jgi:asparagine N-glycosylation enzyme membrane subunit Stt3
LPLFYALIFLSVVFFVTRYFFGRLAAIFSLIFIGFAPMIVQRSCAGWFDTDPINMIFFLLLLIVLEEVVSQGSRIMNIFYSALLFMIFWIFSGTWSGWWFFSLIAVFCLFIFFIIDMVASRNGWRSAIIRYPLLAVAIVSAFCIFSVKFATVKDFFWALNFWYHFGSFNNVHIWPDVTATISEFMPATLQRLTILLYGLPLIILGYLLLCLLPNYYRKPQTRCFLFLAFFMSLACAYLALHGVRFLIFLWLPLGMALSAGFAFAVRFLWRYGEGGGYHRRFATKITAAFIICATFFYCFGRASSAIKMITPLINRHWVSALEYVRNNTPPDAIINTWWDYGDWFKYVANRRVIFDGQTLQSRSIAYWMARAMLSSDETEIMNILRMLNNSSDTLFYDIWPVFSDDFICLEFMDKIVKSDKSGADKLFAEYKIPEKMKKLIFDSVYTSPKSSAYFVVDHSMLRKAKGISLVGGWNFGRLYVLHTMRLPLERAAAETEQLFGMARSEVVDLRSQLAIAGKHPERVISGSASILDKNSLFSRLYFEGGSGLKHFIPFVRDERGGIFIYRIDWGQVSCGAM